MSLIEGVGDEVTVFVGILLLLIIMTLAWVSTGVADRPLVSVVVLDGRTFQVSVRWMWLHISGEYENSHQNKFNMKY